MAWLAMRGRKMKFKNVIHIYVCVYSCAYIYAFNEREENVVIQHN